VDNSTAPLSEKFSLDDVITGLASDLVALREGRISTRDAKVRAEMAKQIFNGVRLVVSASKFMEKRAKPINQIEAGEA
jgi:hypothetical protein